MIGNDPRYQAIIDQYTKGAYNAPYQSMDYAPSPYYNPIYDIRSEQIAAGELPEGARFPKPQLDTTPIETPTEETFDPCPPGYQLIDGVCQPDTMFEQTTDRDGGGNVQGPKISPEGLIEGYEQVLSPGMGAINSMQMMELEKRFGPEMAQQMGLLNQKYRSRGVQYNPTTGKFVAMSPTLGQLGGDIAGGFGNMFGAFGDAAQQYLASGGMLGALANLFTPQPPTVTTGGSSDITVTETGPTVDLRKPVIDELVSTPVSESGSGGTPTGIVRPGYPTPSKTPKKGTGASGPPGRNYSSARSRAAKAAQKLGKKLATRGR
jgi:hypothetical protein